MKKLVTIFLLLTGINFCSQAQWVSIPDTNFGTWLNTNGYSACMQGNNTVGWQMDTACTALINTTTVICRNTNVTDLTGIEYFDNLGALYCEDNLITRIPALPHNLSILNCEDNFLNNLPALPGSLTSLKFGHNLIDSLPTLPNGLAYLECQHNQFSALPTLPNSITQLNCRNNTLTNLPILPSSLTFLDCANNPITALPILPSGLVQLYCLNNQLTSLPALPNNLAILSCFGNQLTTIPALPNSLHWFFCNNNQLNSLPELPDSLFYFYIQVNPLTCLPQLKRIVNFDFSNTLVTCLPNYGNVTNSTPSLQSLPLCQPGNANGCEYDTCGSFQINSITATSTFGLPDTLTANASGGCLPYSYVWSNGGTDRENIITVNGPYIVTVSDCNGCAATASISTSPQILTYPNGAEIFQVNQSMNITWNAQYIDSTFVVLELSPDSGQTWYPLSFPVANTGSFSYQVGNFPTQTALLRLSEWSSLVVKDISDAVFTILPDTLSAYATVTHVQCNGWSNGMAAITALWGISPYQFSINGGITFQSSDTFTNLSAGNYSVIVRDAANSTVTVSFTITEPAPIIFTTSSNTPVCVGDTLKLFVDSIPGATYSWVGPAGYTSTLRNPVRPNATPSMMANYFVSVTVNGCNSGFVAEPVTVISCASSITVTYPNGGEYLQVGQNLNVTWSTHGVIPKVKIEFYGSTLFNWVTLVDSTLNTGVYSFTVPGIPNQDGLIRISKVDSTGINDVSDSLFHIVQAGTLLAHAGADQTICIGSMVTIGGVPTVTGGTPPYAYDWAPGTSLNCTNCANPLAAPGMTTTYTVTVTDNLGTTAIDAVTVFVNPTPVVDAGPDHFLCDTFTWTTLGGSPTASGGSGQFTYDWFPSLPLNSNQVSNPLATPSVTTTFVATATDLNGCMASDDVTVFVNSLNLSAQITNVSCNGFNDGKLIVHSNPYGQSIQYSIDGGITFQYSDTFSNLYAGWYLVIATYNGCYDTDTVLVTEPSQLTAQFITAPGGSQPDTVTAYVQGGTPPYTIDWQCGPLTVGQDTAVRIYNCIAGVYIPFVMDSNGCRVEDTISIGCPDQCVWPGDADYNGLADNNDLLPIGLAYGTVGTTRAQQDINWYAHPSTDWTDTLLSGINYKHIDCDGNGTINADDTIAILQNFGQTHAKTDEDGSEWRMTDPALHIDVVPDTTHAGDTMYANLVLGDISIPASNVYGLAFTINYDALVVDSSKTRVTFGSSWLGNSTDKISIAKDFSLNGQLKCALTRIDHATRSGFGQIGQAAFVITTDNINGKNLAYHHLHVWISDLRMIDNLGNLISVNAGRDSSVVEFEMTDIEEVGFQNAELKIQPNPSSGDVLLVVSENLIGGEMKLFDLEGRVLHRSFVSNRNSALSTQNLRNGIYFVRVRTEMGVITKPLVIAR